MQYMDDLEVQIDKLVRNTIGIDVIKTFVRGILSAEIIIPKNKFDSKVTKSDIKFEISIDSYSPTLYPVPKIYCLTPYCFPNLADGRDLFREFRNMGDYRNGELELTKLLEELIEFVKVNYQRGGLLFCGNYYLDDKYERRLFQNDKCIIVDKVKQKVVLKAKNVTVSRIIILSDVYFLHFKKDKSAKNGLILLFWSSLNNLEKIQKMSDNKTVMLHWLTQDKDNSYIMHLVLEKRNDFLNQLMDRVKNFGMNFDVFKMNNQNQIEHKTFSTDFKFKINENEKDKEKEKEKVADNIQNIIQEEKLDDEDKNEENLNIDKLFGKAEEKTKNTISNNKEGEKNENNIKIENNISTKEENKKE